jgi:transcriptional regulator of nitric oxide reductase
MSNHQYEFTVRCCVCKQESQQLATTDIDYTGGWFCKSCLNDTTEKLKDKLTKTELENKELKEEIEEWKELVGEASVNRFKLLKEGIISMKLTNDRLRKEYQTEKEKLIRLEQYIAIYVGRIKGALLSQD